MFKNLGGDGEKVSWLEGVGSDNEEKYHTLAAFPTDNDKKMILLFPPDLVISTQKTALTVLSSSTLHIFCCRISILAATDFSEYVLQSKLSINLLTY